MLAPVVLFVYNRPEHTQQTVEALKANSLAAESPLIIFSDGPKRESAQASVQAVRDYIKTIDGFKSVDIVEAPQNQGLANSIIKGVSQVLDDHNSVIVLEDDLLTSPNFLAFMNQALEFYQENSKIWSVSGYNVPIQIPSDYAEEVYFTYRGCSWGWATWRDRWQKCDWEVQDYRSFMRDRTAKKAFDRGGYDLSEMLRDQMDGQMDSWAIRWCYSQFKDDSYTVYPIKSKVQNIGYDGSGTHCEVSTKRIVDLDGNAEATRLTEKIILDDRILKNFQEFYSLDFPKQLKRIMKDLGIYNLAKPIKDGIYQVRSAIAKA